MEEVWLTSLRTLLGFFFLLTLTRMLGKKQLSQMTFFTYITGIALGNMAGEMIIDSEIKVWNALIGMGLWTLLTIVIEYINLKSPKVRVLLDGEPTILIKHGAILKKSMSSTRLNMDDLSMLLRNNNIFSIREVEYAILEPNGKLSVLKRVEDESVTKKDLNIPFNQRLYMPTELIVDGKVVQKNMNELNLNQDWLDQQLKLSGVYSIEDVFYAELQSDGNVHVDKFL